MMVMALGVFIGRVDGCMALASTGSVPIQRESAVIIWNADQKTEHFIRQAEFDSAASSVGFLVPTPNVPKIKVADAAIFDLAEGYLPKPDELRGTKALSANSTNSVSGVPVILAEEDVGDYHAVTLSASDSGKLGAWLRTNGYPWKDSEQHWLEPYIKAHWVINMFKLVRKSNARIKTKAVEMSFATNQPYFPYSEPSDAKTANGRGRTLLVSVLATKPVAGALADGTKWPGRQLFSGKIGSSAQSWMACANLDSSLAKRLNWLTFFQDDSNPRPGKDDLYFSAAP